MKRESRLLLLQAMVIAAGALMVSQGTHAQVQVPLADQPLFTTVSVPGNVALALSVEFPTAISVAHTNRTYSSANTYIGYFDPNKCYAYRYTDGTTKDNYFYPTNAATNRTCSGKWSGNYLNWASMQTIDPFRWALTGGYRVIDDVGLTVLEKAWGANQGSTSNFPDSSVSGSTAVSGATPFGTAAGIATRIWSLGNKMRFMTSTSGVPAPVYTNPATHYDPSKAYINGTLYEVFIRVKVCDPTSTVGGLESNCAQYSSSSSSPSVIYYKPTGLMQQYSDRIRFSALGYLNDSNLQRDGGVLRARQKFIAPTMPVPGSQPVSNSKAEWDPATGVMIINPDPTDATATTSATGVTVSNSGVMNYLNKFGALGAGYKTYDPVSELYYAAQRYLRNQGNVPAWSSMGSASATTKTTWVDGFPVITNWDDPIQYSCQRNFILGIGDVNTHADRNLPGTTGASEPTKPAEVANDTAMNAGDWTNQVGVLQGMGSPLLSSRSPYNGCCNNNGALMAGLAYWANVSDVRPDLPGIQTIQTYWLDVMEYQTFKTNNQFYLAAKYGGFNPPASFTPATATASQFANNAATKSWWSTTNDVMSDGSPRPDNYYSAAQADLMVSGLTKAFSSIATKLAAYSTSFSTSQPQVSTLGVSSYAAKYDSKYWTGDVIASLTSFDANSGAPTSTAQWSFSTTLMTQAAAPGWDTGRYIATFNPSTKVGVPFRAPAPPTTSSLASSQTTALTPSYGTGNTATTLVNYIRGDRSNEVSSTTSGSTHAYRDRTNLLGDIVNAKTVPVGPPAFPYSAAFNPGYDTFKSTYGNRAPMVYAGANDGMLHAIDGSLTSSTLSGSTPGKEVWAYVPNAVISGPTGSPSVDGLASLGNPIFAHHYLVDATPTMADIDFGRTPGGTGTADWRTLLIGGLGKGGKALYALDITDPASVTSETTAAQKVLWEFTDSALGFTYGQPIVTKTHKYGWVVIAGSGYNNGDGVGYFFFINPRTGALLEKIAVPCSPTCGSANQAGMAHINAFVLNGADGYADALYGGDLLGNIWRLDVTGSSGYPTPVRFATLTASDGSVLPITTKPLPVVQPLTNLRFVTVGTGRMLDSSDKSSSQAQRFFAILDGTNAAFSQDGTINGTTSSLPTGVTFPITVSQLAARTSLTTQVLLDMRTQLGWYVDLGTATGGAGWRVLTDPTSFYGTVAFAATSPTSTDACSPDGTSRVYVLDLGSGYCALNTTDSGCYASNFTGIITDLRFISRNVNGVGKLSLVGGTSTGGLLNPQLKQTPGIGIKRLNVREIIVN